MVRRRAAALALALFLVACTLPVASCGREAGEREPQGVARDIHGSLGYAGVERSYLLHLPPSYDGEEELPLLFAFHGGGGDGAGMERLTHLSDVADERGFIVVYPDGIDKGWNDGRPEINPGVDDVGFVSALIDELVSRYRVDAGRVYSTGISNGGFFSFRLACELSEKVAAVAPVAALMGENLSRTCAAPRPVAVMIVMGTEDPFVSWSGGEITAGRTRRGRWLSASDTVSFWVKADACSQSPSVSYDPDRSPHDGTRVRRETYAGGRDGTEVILLAVEGGGHTWPGGLQYLREGAIGKTCRDMDAGEAIWDFLERHRLE